jgi:hypothetical protein
MGDQDGVVAGEGEGPGGNVQQLGGHKRGGGYQTAQQNTHRVPPETTSKAQTVGIKNDGDPSHGLACIEDEGVPDSLVDVHVAQNGHR